jgi:hypothetical protein
MKKFLTLCIVAISLIFLVSASAWSNGIVIGPGDLPDWHANSQVQLGWNFADSTNPQNSAPLPGWDIAIGAIPVWNYDADRTAWGQPGQWYIRIPNLINENPVKHFWISWVYSFDPITPGPRAFTNLDWFPGTGYGNVEQTAAMFDSSGSPTPNHFDAAYERITISYDLYPNPNYEDIWLGTEIGINTPMQVLEVYVKTICVAACEGDFESDGDVDGVDLATLLAGAAGVTLEEFAANFGRINCPSS